MAEEPQVIRGIDWREAFPFTHIFRAFRIAIHPSKLVLAFLALTSLYLGGRVLDGLWPAQHRAMPGEIQRYEQAGSAQSFQDQKQRIRERAREVAAGYLTGRGKSQPEFKTAETAGALARDYPRAASKHVVFEAKRDLERDLAAANEAFNKDPKAQDALKRRTEAYESAFDKARDRWELAQAVGGAGLFDSFLRYQIEQVNKVWAGVLSWNWLGGLSEWMGQARGARLAAGALPANDGVVVATLKFFTVAPAWALRHHWVYFLLFGTLFLVVWSAFGGAIARIAAVHVADEGRKLSVKQGLTFGISKFLSFISAPIIPLGIVVAIGLVVAVGGLVFFGIPYVSAYVLEIVGAALFFVALIAGFVMTLVLLGTAGGFNLMYPTIAVEGSDSFDAISRSFSYVYSKPWRMLFYSLVALAYGALCYLFVRVFLWLMLVLTHFFAGLFVAREVGGIDSIWPLLWPAPSFASLPYELSTMPLPWGSSVAATLIAIWVYVTISLLGAFAISFYFSANTIIYYLLRREVDATEMDDVYLEQPEEDFVETPPAAAAPVTAPATASETSGDSASVPGETPPASSSDEPSAS